MFLLITPFLAYLSASNVASCLKFQSEFEAFTLDQSLRCIGGCEFLDNSLQCYTSWLQATDRCRISKDVPTVRYRTEDDNPCISDCDYFGSSSQWCAESESDWSTCSRRIATKGTITWNTQNRYAVCKDECNFHGYDYTWCNTVDGSWSRCNPDHLTVVYDYPTKSGSVCAGHCSIYSKQPHCYNTEDTFEPCFRNPSPNTTIQTIYYDIRKCVYTVFRNDMSHFYCKIRGYDEYYRSKRQVPSNSGFTYNAFNSSDQANNELYFEEQCGLTVEDIMNRQNIENPFTPLRDFDPNRPITTERNPIISFTELQTPSYFTEREEDVHLILNVRAILTNYTLVNPGEREKFKSSVRQHQNGLDVVKGTSNDDDLGHIVASRLGGPPYFYNIFPQPRRANRGRNILWTQIESQLDRFLRGHNDRYVQFDVALSYATNAIGNIIHRPTGVALRVRAYINRQLVDPVTYSPINATNPDENRYENVYFTNDPNCIPLCRDVTVIPNKNNKRKRA